ASFVSVMDISIVNAAMPRMISTFGVSLDAITWVAVAYSISEIIMVTMAAWFSSLLGRKRFFILSFTFFTATSILCGMVRSFELMVLARILQGIGGGGLIPVSQAIMLETFPEDERGMAMALHSMGVVLAPALGPVLGGWLTDAYGWPWIFYINVPVGCVGIIMALTVLADPPYMQRTLTRIDGVGIVLLAVGLTALQLFLERGERDNWFESSFIVVTALVALVTLALLVGWELWVEEPVVNVRLLTNVPFAAGTCLGLLFGITLFGSIFILPLFLQRLQGYSVLDSGLLQMPRMLIMLVVIPIAGRLYNYVDSRLLIGCGLGLMMLGYFDLAGLTLEAGWPQLLPGMLLTGAGMSFMFGTMSAAVMRTVPLPLLTAAASLNTLGRRVGGNIGYAFVASQIDHRSALHRLRLVDHVTPYDVSTMRVLDGLTARLATGSGLPPGVAEESALKLLDGTVNRHATMMAYNDVFWMMGMLFVLCVPFLLLLGSRGRHAAPASA
ncbi:MAG: DHA2 family efflux MFS transporter permease subunit, partial [Candidatus Tectomicrobia bacterium]